MKVSALHEMVSNPSVKVSAVLDMASKQPNMDTVNVVTAIHRSHGNFSSVI